MKVTSGAFGVAGGDPKPRRIAPETGLEPHFHINDAIFEVTSDGSILVTAYEEMHGVLKPAFHVTVMPANLLTMAQKAFKAVADAHNVKILQAFVDDESETSH